MPIIARRLSQELDVRGSPAWSPDGQWIAVAANRDGQPALFKLPINGGAPVLLVQGFALDISPDGRELVFDRSRDESDIVLIERPK